MSNLNIVMNSNSAPLKMSPKATLKSKEIGLGKNIEDIKNPKESQQFQDLNVLNRQKMQKMQKLTSTSDAISKNNLFDKITTMNKNKFDLSSDINNPIIYTGINLIKNNSVKSDRNHLKWSEIRTTEEIITFQEPSQELFSRAIAALLESRKIKVNKDAFNCIVSIAEDCMYF